MPINVAGYVKLAKLWERKREEAIAYHRDYFYNKFNDPDDYTIVDVYVDITGKKEIINRPEMLRLLSDCRKGSVDLIAARTKGYFAANTHEFCFLIKFLFDLEHRIDLLTEDEEYNINTVINEDNQREELYKMADTYTRLNEHDYRCWKAAVCSAAADI